MATYSPIQQQTVLCMLAYMSVFTEGSVAQLQARMTEELRLILSLHELQDLIGRWEVVWGPVIYQAEGSTVADNTMFVVHSLDTPQMVVSIAGTNPYSLFNWLFENLPIRRKEAWPTCGGNEAGFKPEISQGTANGLRILQAMQADGQTLLEFLQAYLPALSGSMAITVTGHSLGGALSSAMAVYLADMQLTWNPDNRAVVSVTPIAGPTPGNLDFAMVADQALNGRIQRIWNDKDVVPHAWDKAQMTKLPTIYAPTIKPNLFIRFVIYLAQQAANRSDYAHLQPDPLPLPGKVVPTAQADDLLPTSFIHKFLPSYMVQMAYQHLQAYYDMLQLDAFAQIMGDKLPEALAGPDIVELRRRIAEQTEDGPKN